MILASLFFRVNSVGQDEVDLDYEDFGALATSRVYCGIVDDSRRRGHITFNSLNENTVRMILYYKHLSHPPRNMLMAAIATCEATLSKCR